MSRLARADTLEAFGRGAHDSDPVRACAACWGNGDGAHELRHGEKCWHCGCAVAVIVRRGGRVEP